MTTSLLPPYRETGFVVVPSPFAPHEIDAWANEADLAITSAHARPEQVALSGRTHLTQGFVLDRIDMAAARSALFRTLAGDPRILDLASQLLETPATLAKDKLITKPPGTHGYLPHQDYPYWEYLGLPPHHLVSALIAIDPCDEHNGALEVYPGLHHERLPSPPDAPLDTDPACLAGKPWSRIDMNPGDILFFHSLTPHKSGINHSTRSRRSLFLTYAPASYPRIYERFQTEKRPAS
ncbi:MAG TPA: phytanoyl-CoA dioxygenase family protein [Kiritimatiellia bacterium]|nr:phytanoyl-CoA dioxygenase family protein [Kiritimatiellia bacterium]